MSFLQANQLRQLVGASLEEHAAFFRRYAAVTPATKGGAAPRADAAAPQGEDAAESPEGGLAEGQGAKQGGEADPGSCPAAPVQVKLP